MHFKKAKRLFWVLLFTLFTVTSSLSAKETVYSDSMIRAAVIFGILRFTTWPEEKNKAEAIILCTYGRSSTDDALAQLEKIPKIGNKPVILKSNITQEYLPLCHAVVVGQKVISKEELDNSVLFICDECESGDIDIFAINLIKKANRIQFSINLDRIKEQELNLSASLIELAANCSSSDPDIRGCDE